MIMLKVGHLYFAKVPNSWTLQHFTIYSRCLVKLLLFSSTYTQLSDMFSQTYAFVRHILVNLPVTVGYSLTLTFQNTFPPQQQISPKCLTTSVPLQPRTRRAIRLHSWQSSASPSQTGSSQSVSTVMLIVEHLCLSKVPNSWTLQHFTIYSRPLVKC